MQTLSSMIFDKSIEYQKKDALKINGVSISYKQLIDHSLDVATLLIDSGAVQEAVGVVGQREFSSYYGVLGTLFAGCHYVPINPKYSMEKINSIIRGSNIKYLVGDKNSLCSFEEHLENDESKKISVMILPVGKVPARSEIQWVDRSALKSSKKLKEPVVSKVTDLAYIFYTSGSTGEPKGVQVAHSNVVSFIGNMENKYPLKTGFRASQMFDFSFDPSVSDMFFTWYMGGVLCVLQDEEIFLPYEFIRREEIEFWNSIPSTIGAMDKMGYLSENVFPSLKYSMFCGEQFPKHFADLWKVAAPNSTVENLYGPTEATIYTSRYLYLNDEREKAFRNNILPIGTPLPSMEIEVIDNNGNKVNKGDVGELVYKGTQISKGYLNDQEKTDLVFVEFDWDPSGDTWYKSGDLGFYNKDGNLECVGRKDSQIKLGGRRIELGEIESVLSRLPLLQDSVVVAIKDENQIVTGCVAFTMNKLSKEDLKQIRKESLNYLEAVFFPKKILTIKTFPRSPSGKIDRKSLTQEAQSL